jgi:hypothetical protein
LTSVSLVSSVKVTSLFVVCAREEAPRRLPQNQLLVTGFTPALCTLSLQAREGRHQRVVRIRAARGEVDQHLPHLRKQARQVVAVLEVVPALMLVAVSLPHRNVHGLRRSSNPQRSNQDHNQQGDATVAKTRICFCEQIIFCRPSPARSGKQLA